MRLGYARVSTERQDPLTQVAALTEAGCVRVVQEVASGADIHRPLRNRMIEAAIEVAGGGVGVEIVVARLDRWSRDVVDGRQSIERLQSAGVTFTSLAEGLDLATRSGLYAATLVFASAEYERSLMGERIMDAKRAIGPHAIGGRPRSLTSSQIEEAVHLRGSGMTNQQVADRLGVSRSTLLRSIKRARVAC